MNVKTVLVSAAALVAAGTIGAASAQSAPRTPEHDQTYQMFAVVASDGTLGANHDATGASYDSTSNVYTVTFSHKIRKCALNVNAGRDSGSDGVHANSVVVANEAGTSKGVIVRFTNFNGTPFAEPLMLTATCAVS